jgi:hypothetical protein
MKPTEGGRGMGRGRRKEGGREFAQGTEGGPPRAAVRREETVEGPCKCEKTAFWGPCTTKSAPLPLTPAPLFVASLPCAFERAT